MHSTAGMAEYCVCPVSGLSRLPEGLAFEAPAILGCAAMTAYGAVVRAAALSPGSTVAVVATGGIGMSVVQIARAVRPRGRTHPGSRRRHDGVTGVACAVWRARSHC
jgi:S-(hydroxymethyl)glutathione dehydrogenase/alcohol dehydrogenase